MFNIPILFEDDQILVISKPVGLVVTPGPGYEEADTLVGWLIDRYGERLRQVGSGSHRPGIVHRLDKETSGVMVVAKTSAAFESLVQQFKSRQVIKEYMAVVWGDVLASGKLKVESGKLQKRSSSEVSYHSQLSTFNFQFIIYAPIGRNPRNRMKFAVREDGKPARTRFEVANDFGLSDSTRKPRRFPAGFVGAKNVTKLKCFPETGRTHQIRVHLKSFGHGVVGDRIYQSRRENQIFDSLVTEGVLSDRMYLHAHKLGLVVPGAGGIQTFETPVPEEF